MDAVLSVLEIIMPIFAAIILGMIARRKALISSEAISGLQQFVMNFALPCVVFNSCLTAKIGTESVGSMLLVLPVVLSSALWAFRARKRLFPYHNFPQLFAAQETGMLGIPLFMILFGADQAYRMGVLDLIQGCVAFPVIAILSAKTGSNPTPREVVKNMFRSPLLIMSLSGLVLNITGISGALDRTGLRDVLTACTSFLGEPVSALMIFSVGYNFSLNKKYRKPIFQISLIHFVLFALFCLVIQAGLLLVPGTTSLTRWAVLLYCMLPASYLAPTLGRSEEDFTVASGVCSMLTIATILSFCLIAAFS